MTLFIMPPPSVEGPGMPPAMLAGPAHLYHGLFNLILDIKLVTGTKEKA